VHQLVNRQNIFNIKMHGSNVKIIMPSSFARPKPATISDDLVQSTKARAEAQQSKCNYDPSLHIALQDFHSSDAKMLSDSEFRAILGREKDVTTVRPVSPLVQHIFHHIPLSSVHLL
jgi:hypothetical protein